MAKESPLPFDFKFSTPIPTKFEFGGQFRSPPKSGAPDYVKTDGRVSGVDKAQFTFELPPNTEKERNTSRHTSEVKDKVNIQGTVEGTRKVDKMFSSQFPSKTHKRVQSSPMTQARQTHADRRQEVHQEETHPPETNDENTFTIIGKQEPKDKHLIHKSFTSKSQAYTYHIDTTNHQRTKQEPPQLSQSFPPSQDLPETPSTPSHRRTKSVITPTRSSRRSKLNTSYAEDSHREFIRDLRQLLGDKKKQRDQEEREIDLQIKKLREEGKAVESTLVGEIPRLPELLARKVPSPHSFPPFRLVYTNI